MRIAADGSDRRPMNQAGLTAGSTASVPKRSSRSPCSTVSLRTRRNRPSVSSTDARLAWECGRDQVARAVAPFGFLDPEGRSTASSDWVRFGQKRPGIQVLGHARQPAALRLEQQLEQRCKEQGMARDTRKPRLSRAFSHSGGGIRTRDLRVMSCIDRGAVRWFWPYGAKSRSPTSPQIRSDWYEYWYETRMVRWYETRMVRNR
jgi:hypothetical protein